MTTIVLDTETCGLALDDDIWEVGAIVRRRDGRQGEFHAFVDHDPAKCINLPPSFRADHVARFPGASAEHGCTGSGPKSLGQADTARVLAGLLGGDPKPHIVGAVPNFDTERIARLLRAHGYEPGWHYHLIDVENLAVGFLRGRLAESTVWMPGEEERLRELLTPPWSSEELSLQCGVEPPGPDERHTALGDAKWALRWYDAITGGAR